MGRKIKLFLLVVIVLSLTLIGFSQLSASTFEDSKEKYQYMHDIKKSEWKEQNPKDIREPEMELLTTPTHAFENMVGVYNAKEVLLPFPSAVLNNYVITKVVYFPDNIILVGNVKKEPGTGIIINKYINPLNHGDCSISENKLSESGNLDAVTMIKEKKVFVIVSENKGEITVELGNESSLSY